MQKIKKILRAVFKKNCNVPKAQSQRQWTAETKFADLPKTSIYNSSTMVFKYYHDNQYQAISSSQNQKIGEKSRFFLILETTGKCTYS